MAPMLLRDEDYMRRYMEKESKDFLEILITPNIINNTTVISFSIKGEFIALSSDKIRDGSIGLMLCENQTKEIQYFIAKMVDEKFIATQTLAEVEKDPEFKEFFKNNFQDLLA